MFFPKKIKELILTWFGCGRAPFAPGTFGSIGALPLCYMMLQNPIEVRLIFAIGMTMIAILAAAQDQIEGAKHDPQYVVVDEVAGMLFACIFPLSGQPAYLSLAAGFVAFRIFDIVKVWPACWFDGKSETDPSPFRRGMHIVLDDIVAGIYAMIVLLLISRSGYIQTF